MTTTEGQKLQTVLKTDTMWAAPECSGDLGPQCVWDAPILGLSPSQREGEK